MKTLSKQTIRTIKQKKTFNIWLIIILCTMPLIFTLLLKPSIDNDLWYILSEGRYIVNNGIYKIDPLSMHEGFSITVQNYLSAVIFYLTYSLLGFKGVYFLVILAYIAIAIILYKICHLISNGNIMLSFLVSFIACISLLCYYMVTRPQIFSFINLLLVIYLLELYIKTNNKKYLMGLPIISLVQVNMHASLWWMIFLFILPYVIDSFKSDSLHLQGYNKKPLFIAIGISLLCGLLNPYGFKAISFIFTSYGDTYMHDFIRELQPFTFSDVLCKNMFIIMLAIGIMYAFFKKGNIRVRYICLFCGTLILGFMSVKGFSHFILVSIFPLAYFFKDMFPNDYSVMPNSFMTLLKVLVRTFGIASIIACTFLFIINIPKLDTNNACENARMKLDELNIEDKKIYSSFNNGGYFEFYGYKPYIDPRAEVFLKVNNHKEDIFEEYYKLQNDLSQPNVFVDKYDFNYLVIEAGDALFDTMDETKYFLLYQDLENKMRLYAKRSLFTKEEIEAYENITSNQLVVYTKR